MKWLLILITISLELFVIDSFGYAYLPPKKNMFAEYPGMPLSSEFGFNKQSSGFSYQPPRDFGNFGLPPQHGLGGFAPPLRTQPTLAPIGNIGLYQGPAQFHIHHNHHHNLNNNQQQKQKFFPEPFFPGPASPTRRPQQNIRPILTPSFIDDANARRPVAPPTAPVAPTKNIRTSSRRPVTIAPVTPPFTKFTAPPATPTIAQTIAIPPPTQPTVVEITTKDPTEDIDLRFGAI